MGLVARLNLRRNQAFCYFFGPRRKRAWKGTETAKLEPGAAVLCVLVGTVGMTSGRWVRIGKEEEFDLEKWTMPAFLVGDVSEGWYPGLRKVWLKDDDPGAGIAREEPATRNDLNLPVFELYGHIALEEVLDGLL